MHEFMTVKMIAIKAMDYAEFPVAAGEEFYATPDDARYFEKHGRARLAPPDKPEPAIYPQEADIGTTSDNTEPRRRGRPRKQDAVVEVVEVAEETAIEAPEADEQQ